MKRLIGIGAVWFGCAFAWMLLGATVSVRSDGSSSRGGEAVYGLWGPRAVQQAPSARFERRLPATLSAEPMSPEAEDGTSVEPIPGTRTDTTSDVGQVLRLTSTRASVEFDLEHRKKGLIWFPTYDVSFVSDYTWTFDGSESGTAHFSFPLQQAGDSFDGFVVMQNGERVRSHMEQGEARWSVPVEEGEARELRFYIRYRSRGTTQWTYRPTEGTGEVENFYLTMRANTDEIDFGEGSLSPTSHGTGPGDSWEGCWEFQQLISGDALHVVMPQRINPGPLAGKITFFAPISLLFFFFVVALVARARAHELHPMHFFFFGCAFFAFDLLFAYLVDHVDVFVSFAISTAVSLFLSVSYARHFVGMRFAVRVIGLAQLIYLVLFSASFFLEGFTGLTVTIGAILTLYVMMQLTGRTAWGEAADDEGDQTPGDPETGMPARF